MNQSTNILGTDIAVLVMGRMEDLTHAVEDQANESRQFREQFREYLEARQAGTSTQHPSRDMGSDSEEHDSRERKINADTLHGQKREKRVQKKARRQRACRGVPSTVDDSDDDVDDEEGELDEQDMQEKENMDQLTKDKHKAKLKVRTPEVDHLPATLIASQRRVRKSFDDMLNVVDWANVHLQYPALSEDDITAYIARDPKFVPTVQNFIVDFSPGHGWKTFALNKEARDVFITRYLARVAGGAYFKDPTPRFMLTRKRIRKLVDGHMKHLRDKWRKALKPLDPKKAADIARRVCQNARKFTVSGYVTIHVTKADAGFCTTAP